MLTVSVLISVTVWCLLICSADVVLILYLALTAAYTYLLFYCGKKHGRDFALLSALISTVVQGTILYLLMKHTLSGLTVRDEHGTGHINGSAVGILLIVFAEPLLINVPPTVLWVIKKIILYFKNTENS